MNRNVVITGANRGIGLALCKHYTKNGDKVFAVCRSVNNELLDTGANIINGIDVSQASHIENLRASLHDKPIDILINNAGVWTDERYGNIDYDQLDQVMRINALAPLRISEALLTNMGTGTKIALISSRMGSISDNTSGGRYAYRMSKAALNAAGKSMAEDLREEGIAVAILHPGYVQTDMTGGGDIDTHTAAERLAQRIGELNLSNTGTFWHSNGSVLPW